MSKVFTSKEREQNLKLLLSTGWIIKTDRDAIFKEFVFADFNQVFGFACRVAMYVDKMNCYPEWCSYYNKMKVTLPPYDVNGLSQEYVKVATFMDEVANDMQPSK